MRRLLRVVCLVVGLLLTAAGAVGAALVGSDDVYLLEARSAGAAPGQLVATHPDLTSWQGVDLVVRAESAGGAVLAVGSAADVDAYLERTGHRLVTGLGSDGLDARTVDGPAPALPVARVDDWSAVASGGAPELTVRLDGRPVRVLAAPLDPTATVDLAFGVHVAGAFVLLVVTSVVGALLAALSFRALWIRRGGRSPGGDLRVPAQRRPADSPSPVVRRTAVPPVFSLR